MRIESDGNPYDLTSSLVGGIYSQSFDAMNANGDRGFVPDGWAYYDEVVENDVNDPDDDEIIYNTFATNIFPPKSPLAGPSLFNAGVPGDSDRALTIGTHSRSGESTIQFVTELTGGDARSLQLAFDVEAWESDRRKNDPGEAAFNVVLDVDTGAGFEQLLDLGTVTTGATLVPATEDYVNGNDDAYRISFDSGKLNVNIPDGSQLRVRWMADLEAETRGWVYGLDNVSLGLFVEVPLLGDFDGDGLLSAADVDLLSREVRTGVDLTFDTNADGLLDMNDHQHWVTSTDYANTLIGDVDLDGKVDFPDFLAVSAGFGKSGRWGEGDFDGDGQVDFPDFLILSVNFGAVSSDVAAAVPEPGGVCLAMFGILGLIGLRRSR